MKRPRSEERLGWIVWDAETTGLFEADSPAPRILCVCTQRLRRISLGNYEHQEVRRWHSADLASAKTMSNAEVKELVEFLAQENRNGYVPIGWNTLGYDLRVLHCAFADEADDGTLTKEERLAAQSTVLELADSHTDPMFCFFMAKGFPVKLGAVAKAFRLGGKSGDGAEAVRRWNEGDASDREWVVDYCAQDVAVTSAVIAEVEKAGSVRWITQKGTMSSWVPVDPMAPLMSVSEASKLPPPENSWMKRGGPNDTVPCLAGFRGWVDLAKIPLRQIHGL